MGGRPGGEKTSELTGGEQSLERRVLLLVHHAQGSETVPLSAGRPLTLGRDASSSVPLPDSSVSRRHACFELRGHEVWLEDLGSRNGTTVNGQAVTAPRVVVPGDEIRLGGVAVELHVRDGAARALGLETYDVFLRSAGLELRRVRQSGRTAALMLVRSLGPVQTPLTAWGEGLRPILAGPVRATAYSANEVLVLGADLALDEALALAREVSRSDPRGLAVAVAMFPEDAAGLDELLERVLESAASATRQQPVVRAHRAPPVDAAAAPQPSSDGPMAAVMAMAVKVARAKLPVLIRGETGVGKEVLAQRVHQWSGRAAGPMRSINCGSIPRQLLESALFGHEKGAFTGADKPRRGLFEEASGGTVFLDEVGELSPEAQVALLRVLEEQRVMRVGSSEEIEVDVRIVAATHRDLEAMVGEGTFRRDLLYRLNAVTLAIPPLRERTAEILPLAKWFLERARQTHGAQATGIDPEALALLHAYAWPGNIRELRNVIERAAVIAETSVIRREDLPDALLVARLEARRSSDAILPPDQQTLRVRVEGYERQVLLSALEAVGWNMSQAARDLGMPYRTFTGKLRQLGIQRPKGE